MLVCSVFYFQTYIQKYARMCKKEGNKNAHSLNKVLTFYTFIQKFFLHWIHLLLEGHIKSQNSLAYFLIFKDGIAHRTMPSMHLANIGRNIYLLPPHIWLAGVSAHWSRNTQSEVVYLCVGECAAEHGRAVWTVGRSRSICTAFHQCEPWA